MYGTNTHQARKLANKKYLMVHGTADDNVHYQQSMLLSAALEEKDILFRCTSTIPNIGLQKYIYFSSF